jgi:hypothetical protein
MRPLAHHLGEQSLATLLLLGGGTLPLVVAIGRARLASVRVRLARRSSCEPGSRTGKASSTGTG